MCLEYTAAFKVNKSKYEYTEKKASKRDYTYRYVREIKDEQACSGIEAAPSGLDATKTDMVQQAQLNWLRLEQELQHDADLVRLYQQMYPPTHAVPAPPATAQVRHKETHTIQRLLAIVQDVNLVMTQLPLGWQDESAHTWPVTFWHWLHAPLVRERWQQYRKSVDARHKRVYWYAPFSVTMSHQSCTYMFV